MNYKGWREAECWEHRYEKHILCPECVVRAENLKLLKSHFPGHSFLTRCPTKETMVAVVLEGYDKTH